MKTNYERKRNGLLALKNNMDKKDEVVKSLNKFEKQFDALLSKALFQLTQEDAFYGAWALHANRVKCYALGAPLSHQVTNKGVNLLINPFLFIEYEVEDAKLLVKHEIIHLISEHYKRVEELKDMYPEAIPLLASDLIANHLLAKEATLPDIFWTPKSLEKHFDMTLTITDQDTVESLSERLNEQVELNHKFRLFVETKAGKDLTDYLERILQETFGDFITFGDLSIDRDSFEEDMDYDPDNDMDFDIDFGGEEVSAQGVSSQQGILSQLEALFSSIIQATQYDSLILGAMLRHITVEAASKSRGKYPAGLAGLISALMQPPEITWEQELRRFIGSIPAGNKPTIMRRNRRQPYRLDLKGQLKAKEIDLVVAIDTSGSMCDKVIERCMKEIFDITKLIKTDITILECDATIQKEYKAKCPSDVQPEILGRGGTAFTPVFNWLKDNKKKDAVLIYMSDGYGENKLECKGNYHQSTLWLMTENKDSLSLKGDNLPANSKVISFNNK